jgi:hypothetical protein
MKFFYKLTYFLFLLPAYSVAQVKTGEVHLDHAQVHSNIVIYLVKKDTLTKGSAGYYIKTTMWHPWENTTEIKYYPLDSLLFYNEETRFGPGVTYPEKINIKFVTVQDGFLFGYGVIYAHYPFLYRTADGGKTWTPIRLDTGPLSPTKFYMFNDKRGMILADKADENSYYYYTTVDGGINWLKQAITMNSAGSTAMTKPYAVFRPDGLVTLVFGADVFQSNDFGNTFRSLK